MWWRREVILVAALLACVVFSFHEILAYTPEGIDGKSIWELIYDEDIPKVKHLATKRGGENLSDSHYECRLVRGDGRIIWKELCKERSLHDREKRRKS